MGSQVVEMRDKRRKRKKKMIIRSEKRVIDRILRAAFTGEQLQLIGPAVYVGVDDYKKLAVEITANGNPIVRFYIPAFEAITVNRRHNTEITARKAMEFFNEHQAHVVYPLFD